MKELKEIGRKVIPYGARLKIATGIRDYSLVARGKKGKKYSDFDYSVEVFSNKDITRDPDSVGITVFYPKKDTVTHMITGIYTLSIGEVEFGRQVTKLYKDLRKKIKGV